jgi:hypothetical protein
MITNHERVGKAWTWKEGLRALSSEMKITACAVVVRAGQSFGT